MSQDYAAYNEARNAASNIAAEPSAPPVASNTTQPFTANVLYLIVMEKLGANKAQNPVHTYQYVARTGVPGLPAIAHPFAVPPMAGIPVANPATPSLVDPAPATPTYYYPQYYYTYGSTYPYPSYPAYSADPTAPTAANNLSQAQTPTGSTHHIHYGRTRPEVMRDQAYQRNQTAAAARVATERFKPDAQPHDLFWVVEADGYTRNLMSFATIQTYKDGRWVMDGIEGIAYFLRGYPLPSD